MATGYAFTIKAKDQEQVQYLLVIFYDVNQSSWKLYKQYPGPVFQEGNFLPVRGGKFFLNQNTSQFGDGTNYGKISIFPISQVALNGEYDCEVDNKKGLIAKCVEISPLANKSTFNLRLASMSSSSSA